ncbi:MAG: flavin monoamine oxidase family protein [Chitinophagales bacterium]
MTRNRFIKICGILGVSIPFQASLSSCEKEEVNPSDFSGKVLIIGAGAGGLSSGYLLQQQGIEFEILEASSNYGGRMKINTDFADFPIPLGAEWLHSDTNTFQKLVNDSAIEVNVDTVNYDSEIDTNGLWEEGELTVSALDDSDIKFINSSWFNFYEEYIIPSITDHISYNTIVQSIDYSGDQVVVNTQNGQHTADKVIISVPLKILQEGDISFEPTLPQDKVDAIEEALVWDGFKAFIEFSEKFYDTQIDIEINPVSDGAKLYYDAAYGQNTSKHILGLFAVGKPAMDYLALSEDELRDLILSELDEMYPNQATPNYIKHISQNWNKEPFIKGGYMSSHADWRTVRELGKSVADKIYFAGGAYTDGEDWVAVHTIAQSAKDVVEEILN